MEEWRGALAEAKLALRVDRDAAAARAVLDRASAAIPSTGLYRELLDTWLGLALLLESHDAAALALLRRTVTAMLAGDRILELPTAAVYLAEAEWRAHDEDAADRAADIALDAAGLESCPPSGAGRLPGGGVTPHRRRADARLRVVGARPRADRPARSPARVRASLRAPA
jgi:hypothetical protein